MVPCGPGSSVASAALGSGDGWDGVGQPGALTSHRRLERRGGSGATWVGDVGELVQLTANIAAHSIELRIGSPPGRSTARRSIQISYQRAAPAPLYQKPQPIWFAANQSTMSEKGTPNNHATPYFISRLLRICERSAAVRLTMNSS